MFRSLWPRIVLLRTGRTTAAPGLRCVSGSSPSVQPTRRSSSSEDHSGREGHLKAMGAVGGAVSLAMALAWAKAKTDQNDASPAGAYTVQLPRPLSVSAATPSRRESFNFIADVVDDVAAALVYIEIKDLGVRDFYTGVPMTTSNGSGFIVGADGLILTNAHVVVNKPRASVQVRLQDGRTFTGVVEDVDVKSDLATVRIPCQSLPVMPLGQSSTVRPGEFVIAMGSPLSLSNTITTGVISSVSRQRSELGLRDKQVPDYIQTDAAITFGNSGGPLVNLDGQAIGINSMKVTPGISFAIPIDYAKEFLDKSAANGKSSKSSKPGVDGSASRRRYVGITMLTINQQVAEELRVRLQMPNNITHGVVLFKIVHGSPADLAGLLPGDVVTHVNGKAIYGSSDVYAILEDKGDLNLTVVRRNQRMNVLVKPDNIA